MYYIGIYIRCEYNLMPRAYNIHSSSGVVMYYKSRERSLYPDMGDFPRWSPNGTILHYYTSADYTECARRSEDEFAFLTSSISRCEQHKIILYTDSLPRNACIPLSRHRAVEFTGKSNYTFTVKNAH